VPGFSPGIQASRRWQELAQRKRLELEEQITRLKTMQRLVDSVLQCRCIELEECGRMAAAVMEAAL
jgi:hypothetical protein